MLAFFAGSGYDEGMEFRDILKREMNYRGMRVRELAERAGIGVSTIHHYLSRDGGDPTAAIALKIARVLDVPVEYLLTGKGGVIEAELRDEVRDLLPLLNVLADDDLSLVRNIAERLGRHAMGIIRTAHGTQKN